MRYILILAIMFMVSTPAQANHGGKHIFVTINGLVCDFCARSMEKVFGQKEPVSGVKVDLTTKIVTIDLKKNELLSDDEITKGVVDAGYNVVAIKRD